MITYYFRTIKDTALNIHESPRAGVWAHVVSPTEKEIQDLVENFGLDATILADAEDLFEIPRLERSGGSVYFFTRFPYDVSREDIDTAPILVVVGESSVITIAYADVPFLEPLTSGKREAYTTQKAKLFLQIMSALTESYNQELIRMRRAVHKDRVRLRGIRSTDIERFVTYEQTLNEVISALVPTNVWLRDVLSGNYLQLYTEDVALVEDLTIANSQLVDSAKSILKTIQNIRSAYEAILTNRLNTTIRVLTALTILLTLPTIIASLYGMNVALPLGDHPYAFWLIITVVLAAMGMVAYFFARNRWL